MKKARPNWQNYFVAVCLMALAFYGYLFLAGSSNHGHNIFLYLMVAGMACGLICYAALVPSAARLLAVSGSQKA